MAHGEYRRNRPRKEGERNSTLSSQNNMSNFFEVSLVFLYIFYAVGASSLPTYVTRCLNGTFDGTNLIQVNCTSHADLGQFPISYNLNNGVINTSDTTTPTRIQNCQFNGCGNIYTTAPLLFQNVIFNHLSFVGVLSQTAGGGGAVLVLRLIQTVPNHPIAC